MMTKEEQEILDIVKEINEIDEQLKSDSPEYSKLVEITLKAKKDFLLETSSYEAINSFNPNTKFIHVNEMTIGELISRLPFYKSLYLERLRVKSVNEYNNIVQKS